jgi:hypothetical protein
MSDTKLFYSGTSVKIFNEYRYLLFNVKSLCGSRGNL